MMSKDEIRKMTVPQLRQLIRQHNVRGYSSMKKEQLVDIIHKKQQTTKRNLKPQLPLDVVVNRALTAKEERVRKKKFQQKKRGPTKLERKLVPELSKKTFPKGVVATAAEDLRRSTRARRAPRKLRD